MKKFEEELKYNAHLNKIKHAKKTVSVAPPSSTKAGTSHVQCHPSQ
jgi:hypothetical protein